MESENKFVLIANNEHELLYSFEQQLADHQKGFTIIAVEDGDKAIKKLAHDDISLVVTDLNIPNTDGFGLLSHIVEFYPDISVIVMTESSNAEMESLILEAGAVGCINKPFEASELVGLASNWLQREADGGTLRNVSSGMFLQFIEMEQKTCTIRLIDKASGKRGVLFFRNGELLDARVNGLAKGEEAAYHIFSWDEVTLYIQNSCRCYEKKIAGDLHTILLEAMRLKDEAVVIVPTTVVDAGVSESNAAGGRSKRRDYRVITKLSDFVYVEFLMEIATGSSKHYRLNVINYSSHGIGIIVSEKDFDLLRFLKKGDAIKNVTFSASWSLNTVDVIVKHISKMENGPHAGVYVVGVETRELITNAQPSQKK
ncbi:MAG: response regulator [Pseudomonadota bacterium]|nr:response regulator [Pseudomonadota bacterium]